MVAATNPTSATMVQTRYDVAVGSARRAKVFGNTIAPGVLPVARSEMTQNPSSQVVSHDNQVLHVPAETVKACEFGTSAFKDLVGRLLATFDHFYVNRSGVGLAAPQIGVSKRVCVAQDFELGPQSPAWARDVGRVAFDRLVLCNPVITGRSGEQVCWESCLSQGDLMGMVSRSTWLKVEYQDVHGQPQSLEAVDWKARILQHEIDHLDGCLCASHYLTGTSMPMSEYLATWRNATLAEALAAFQGKTVLR